MTGPAAASRADLPCTPAAALEVRHWGRREYASVWRAMRQLSEHWPAHRGDALWVVEHEPVYTLGLNGDAGHVLAAGDIPLLRVDRGGQVTYHGPGQTVIYTLLGRAHLRHGVRALVERLEQAVIHTLQGYGIDAERRAGAPGVYVGGAKIAALGLRVKRGRVYHGLSVNVAMDLEPFRRIHPCGLPGLRVTQVSDLGGPRRLEVVNTDLIRQLQRKLRPLPNEIEANA